MSTGGGGFVLNSLLTAVLLCSAIFPVVFFHAAFTMGGLLCCWL